MIISLYKDIYGLVKFLAVIIILCVVNEIKGR